MAAQIIDGKQFATHLRADLKKRVDYLRARNIIPRLDVILIGEHAASVIYVRNKERAAAEAGIICTIHRLYENASQDQVLQLIGELNRLASHGILLQLPLPAHLDMLPLLDAIDYTRDVDGLNLVNVGRRTLGLPGLLPCTPKGCLELIKSVRQDLKGLQALVVGRSDLVGKPMAQLLLRENCTVTQAHAHTTNLPELCGQADIVVVAIGKSRFIKGEWLKPGAIVIDVGINRENDQLCGDVDFDSALSVAGAVTPVPGGVGPMTIAMLLENTIEVAEKELNDEVQIRPAR